MSFTPVERNSEFFTSAGQFLQTLGSGLLFAEVILGLISIDIAMLIIIMKHEKEGKHPGFLTGYLWGRMHSDRRCFEGIDLCYVALGSFLESLIAGVLLSIEFATPVIAFAILGAWFVTLSMIALGKAFEDYGKRLSDDKANNKGSNLFKNDLNQSAQQTYDPGPKYAPSAPSL